MVVCGLGRIGWHHADCCGNTKGLSLVGVCDTNKDVLQKAKVSFKVPVFTSSEEMLSQVNGDMVVVATPSHLHAEMVMQAFKQGYHVMVEKPMARNAAEAKKMIMAANQAKKYLTVNQSMRYQPDTLFIKQLKVVLSEKYFKFIREDMALRKEPIGKSGRNSMEEQ